MKKLKLTILTLLFFLTLSARQAVAQNVDQPQAAPKAGQNSPEINNTTEPGPRSLLLYFTSPLASYQEATGATWNFLPLGFEIPLSNFVGAKFEPNFLYRTPEISSFQFTIALPLYPNQAIEERPYGGFYFEPFINLAFFSNQSIGSSIGLQTGTTLNADSGFHIHSGVGIGYNTNTTETSFFFDIGVGFWL